MLSNLEYSISRQTGQVVVKTGPVIVQEVGFWEIRLLKSYAEKVLARDPNYTGFIPEAGKGLGGEPYPKLHITRGHIDFLHLDGTRADAQKVFDKADIIEALINGIPPQHSVKF